jgi:hypothetical protein
MRDQTVSITRDPRIDPQRGDEMRCGGLLRRVVRREDAILWCRSGGMPYRIRLDVWRKWCTPSTRPKSKTLAGSSTPPLPAVLLKERRPSGA